MRRCAVVFSALVLVAALSGCGRLLGQRYDNFTAYYNTFYNAKQAFEQEEKQLLTEERPVDRDRYLPLFVEPDGRQAEGFAKAVEKGADLLREHPESKWVDDALLLIGKAYFYQGNFSGAEQKFRETIALDEEHLEDEAWFWLGRTLAASERYEDAALALREGLDREGVREEWAARMRLVLADVDVREGEWGEAVESLRAGLEGLRDDELAARATFLLGQVYETQGHLADAAEAYGRVLDFGPRYELSYAAQLSRALTLGLGEAEGRGEAGGWSEAGGRAEGERALDGLRRMLRDDKNFENRAEIELTRARVLAAVGRPDEARALLQRLLYDRDPTLRIGALQGEVHYRLAEVYRDGLRDYVRAAAHYDSAATSIRQPDLLDAQATAQAITDAPAQAETFGSYARVAAEVAEMDSLLYLGSLDDDAFAEAIEQIREQRTREARAEAEALARRRSEQGFGGPGLEGFGETDRGVSDAGAGGGGDAGSGANAGFLNFRNPVRVQEELIAFQAQWGDRPLAPNWRRAAAIGGGAEVREGIEETLAGIPQIQTPGETGDAFVDVSVIPRDPLAQQQMRADRAATLYELGNVLFLSLNEPDSASVFYRNVIDEIDEDAGSPVEQRAYFALAEAQRALGNVAEAEQLYYEVIERYPDSRFADRARGELGLAPPERAVASDSLELAEAAYEEAYARWKDGDYAEALGQLLTLSEQYPTTPAAARARLAAGALYTEWAAGNEDALFAAEPLVLTDPELPAPRAPADAEGTPEGTQEGTPTDSLAAPDGAPGAPDGAPGAPDGALDSAPDSAASPRAGTPSAEFPSAAKGFTWVVASEADSLAAARAALAYRERGFDAYVVSGEVPGGTSYRVGIGRFAERAEALAARSALPDDAPEDTWLLAVPAADSPSDSPTVSPSVPAGVEDGNTEDVRALGDSTLALTDSTIAFTDSTLALTDSTLALTDSTLALTDSTIAFGDTAVSPTDSVGVVGDSVDVAVDSVSVPVEEAWLETLYASIEADFPGTPFAERARTLRDALGTLREGPLPDSVAVDARADAGADSLRLLGEAGLRGAAPIVAQEQAFTWSVFTSPVQEEAGMLLLDAADEGYRTALYAEEGEAGTTYHVIVGQFASPDAAEAVRLELLDTLGAEGLELLELVPGTVLEQPDDVLRSRNQ